MKALPTRILSAVIGLTLMFALFYFFEANGLRFLCLAAVVLGTREISRILFSQDKAPRLKIVFALLAIALFGFGVWHFNFLAPAFGVGMVFFFSLTLFARHSFATLDDLSRFLSRAILGLFYVSLLPAFASQILNLEHGMIWFFALLAIVFAGDTFAYIAGVRFGKNLLMPQLSPKKTLEGSVGGLLGSCVAAGLFHLKLPLIPIYALVLLGLTTGFIGQMGDLFESMLKRVANQKDSGSLMPGHGGILDRIDGVLFAAPVLLAGASMLEALF